MTSLETNGTMPSERAKVLPKVLVEQREIGRFIGEAPGPSLIITAGIHGNEPAGIVAARRVFARLGRGDVEVRGELVAFAGNVRALQAGIRYERQDLNRLWTDARVRELRDKPNLQAEDREQIELFTDIEAAVGRARGTVYLGDFHTSSAAGIPFILFGDTLEQRKFGRIFPLPVVIGLEEQLEGVLSAFWTRRNCVTFGCEGGQHDDPASADSLEAVLWLALTEAGLLATRDLEEVTRSAMLLEKRRAGLPRVLEVISRHAITEEDEFRMEPGFRNLDHASPGRVIARDRHGVIRARTQGMVILPLYQGLGSDGFFWGRAVTDIRLKASEFLRRAGLGRVVPLLPGVEAVRDDPSCVVLDPRFAKFYPREVFHVFGYRRIRQRDLAADQAGE